MDALTPSAEPEWRLLEALHYNATERANIRSWGRNILEPASHEAPVFGCSCPSCVPERPTAPGTCGGCGHEAHPSATKPSIRSWCVYADSEGRCECGRNVQGTTALAIAAQAAAVSAKPYPLDELYGVEVLNPFHATPYALAQEGQ